MIDWLDKHLQWYTHNNPDKHKEVYQGKGGEWFLTTDEKKKILLSCIYGVDIDPQAVEVTKLSLLLKVLEGENKEHLASHRRLFHDRVLPDLATNIKCGNSLIGPDFYTNQPMTLFDEETQYRINVFDWEKAFPSLKKAGGFDAVIGNPPYVRQEGLGEAKPYFQSHYQTYCSTADLYVNFIEKGLALLKPSGLFGMIVSNPKFALAF